MRKKNIKKGFTLVELLAVIAILAMILLIAVPKLSGRIESNKKNTFIVNARNIIRQIEYDNIELNTFTKVPLSDLELNEFMNDNLDSSNSYAYIVDDKIFLDLKGINQYKDYYLCNVSNTKKKVEVQSTPCDNEHNLIYIDFTVNLDGGATSQYFEEKYLSGNYLVLQIPIKSNESFLGWELVSGNSELDQNRIKFGTENTEVKAIWGNNPLFIINLNGGTSNQKYEESYVSGTIIELEEPTREGYVFRGWKKVVGNPTISGNILTTGTENTVIEALWELGEFTISYELNGGTMGENAPTKGAIGSSILVSNPTKTGYTFTGWEVYGMGALMSNTVLTIGSSDIILIATWEITNYTITYNLDEGTSGASAPTSGIYGSIVTISDPTREGYTFNGWSVSGTGALMSGTNLTIGTSDITLTANWIANRLPTLHGNSPEDVTITVGGSTTLYAHVLDEGYPSNISYQWYLNGSAIQGATSATYTYNNYNHGVGTKYFHCVVTNGAGSVSTRTATVTVNAEYIFLNGTFYNGGSWNWVSNSDTFSECNVSNVWHLGVDGSGHFGATWTTAPVDVTGKSKLIFTVTATDTTGSASTGSGVGFAHLGITDSANLGNTNMVRATTFQTFDNFNTREYVVDVSNISGSYYVKFVIDRTNTVYDQDHIYVSAIRFE